jgi:hypothetical protein
MITQLHNNQYEHQQWQQSSNTSKQSIALPLLNGASPQKLTIDLLPGTKINNRSLNFLSAYCLLKAQQFLLNPVYG